MRDKVDDALFGGDFPPTFKFKEVGATIRGTIVSASARQDADYKTKKPKWWPASGRGAPRIGDTPLPGERPVMVPIFVLETEIRDSEEDDGRRSIWLRGDLQKAVVEAIRLAFPRGQRPTMADCVGGVLAIRHHAMGQAQGGNNAPRLYKAKFDQPTAPLDENPAPPPAAPAAPAKPAPAKPSAKQSAEDW